MAQEKSITGSQDQSRKPKARIRNNTHATAKKD